MHEKFRVSTTLPAADFERAKLWYKDKLGLSPVWEREGAGAYFECAEGTGFLLYPTSFGGKAENTAMGMEVTDIDHVVGDLKSKGVEFLEYDSPPLVTENSIATLGPIRGAWFKDSEGNIIGVTDWGPEGRPKS